MSNIYVNMSLINYSSAEWNNSHGSPWIPDPTFVIPESDMIAIFLALNGMLYRGPVYDPMFLANGSDSDIQDDGSLIYRPTNEGNVMVCGDQHQICNPSNAVCSKFSREAGISSIALGTNALRLNAAQQATADRFYGSITEAGLYNTVNDLGPQALQAQNVLTGTSYSASLPSNQWQIEASRWFEAALVRTQAYMVDWVRHSWVYGNEPYAPVHDPRTLPKKAGPDGDYIAAEQYQCNNQIIRSTGGVQNFSLAGIIVIVLVSCLIIGLGTFLESFVAYCRKLLNSRTGILKDLSREADDKNMLLSLALEGAGSKAPWELRSFGIPITEEEGHDVLPIRRPDGLVGYQFEELKRGKSG
jgi:hypothetical protein